MHISNRVFVFCFVPMLIACPVGPDAVKTVDEEGPSEPILTAPSEGGQITSPNGTPSNMGGNNMAAQGEMGSQGMGTQGEMGQMGQNGQTGQEGQMGQNGQMGQEGQMGQNNQGEMGSQGMGAQGEMGQVGQNGQPGQDGQMGQNGQMGDGANQVGQVEGGGELSDDVIPMYSKAPVFDDIIGQGESITIQLSVSASQDVERFNCEFIVAQTTGNRVAPKVLHMEQVTGTRTSIIAPKNYEEDVYVVITYDVNDDGPGDDDLLGGSKGTIRFGAEDLILNYELSSDDSWMEELPWYTRVGTVQTPNGAGGPN